MEMIRTFATRQEAEDYKKMLDNAVYICLHNEAGRPCYRVKKIGDKYGIRVGTDFFDAKRTVWRWLYLCW